MEKEDMVSVPYIVHESAMARAERTIKKLWILTIILVLLLFGSNAAWIYYENSFEDTVITQENTDGLNNYIGNNGDIFNYPGDDNGK